MTRRRGTLRLWATFLVLGAATLAAAGGSGIGSIKAQDLKEWLTFVSSDELEGRAIYSTGLGLAASYIQGHLQSWGVKPAGDPGAYLQTVPVLGVKSTNRSTVTIEVGGESRTFPDGQGIRFPRNVGGKRRFTIDRVEFAGYGFDAPAANHVDFADKNLKDAAVIWLGTAGPSGLDQEQFRNVLVTRNRYAIDELHAAASIGPQSRGGGAAGPNAAPNVGRGAQIPLSDFATTQRLDKPLAPNVTASDAVFDFLFSRAPVKYAELKKKAADQDPLTPFRLDGVKLTFDLDADYEIVRTQYTQNIVGIVEGSDPQLKSTFVAFGAHYDHLGYAQGDIQGGRRIGAPGRVSEGALDDRVWNGADDDGSGVVAEMAIARAFAEGPRPKRSVLLVWHSGEESGLFGSRYFADYPTVDLDKVVAELNIDMIGRNRADKATEANTVYLVGSDRISTELHNINRAANQAMPKPLTLNYEFNDPFDLEQLYFRSDHYSYAAKGIPIIFFTTGLHLDYHANTDEVGKIEFEKMTRIAQMIYETGWRLANLDHVPVRDNLGPRTTANR